LLAALLLSGQLLSAAADGAEVRVVMADMDWNSIDHTHCRFLNKQQLLDEVSAYAETIAALIGREDWAAFYGTDGVTVEIRFTDGASHVEGGYESYLRKIPRIYINRTVAEQNFWPLAHELTHLICPAYSSLSLREGLACYMQDTVGQNPAIFNYGLDVHSYAYHYLAADDTDHLVLTVASNTAINNAEERAAIYLCGYSFSRYLIETYGIGPFMELYNSSNFPKACTLELGRSADSQADDWKQFLYAYPHPLSQDALDQALKDLVAQHGAPVSP